MADYFGSRLKFLVEPSADGFVKTRDNFIVTISCGEKKQEWEKDELIVDEHDNYYVPVDTEFFGTGVYIITVKTFTPDEDFDDGFRIGIDQMELCNILKPRS